MLVNPTVSDHPASELVELRRAAVPTIGYPPELPVSQHKDELLTAIRDHQVVIVAGETGSGKTTQLPKICLELGRGIHGSIGHTQPRRIAARTVAARIAEELKVQLGDTVGFQVRFTDKVNDRTLIKVMTDGILLNEIQRDRQLSRYDTLIIDEAHERSLNIDFILGYLARLLPKRPDLKVIITSATIDPDRFANHFAAATGAEVPIVEVSGRTYPVEVRYRPIVDTWQDTGRDQVQAILDAVDELVAEGPGDILVFLSGEREITDTADALTRHDLRDVEVLPLYARLSASEQYRVFQPGKAGRRIVLATNVAETSLTVPGIRYVIDPGTARISRYNPRSKVQRLPIESISQASANQRKGRAGRLSEGICIRLYSEEDFVSRPEYTDPEILRTNLASVLLQMASLGLGDLERFPFVQPPDRRQVTDGVLLLEELGAFRPNAKSPRKRLTGLGRRLARIPTDPRLGRMILEAERRHCVHQVLVITAALSIQDPRERPSDSEAAADQKHARFTDKTSDFATLLNLWNYLQEQQQALSSSAFRRLCRKEFLHYLRVREWQDLYGQLRQVVRGLGVDPKPRDADAEAIHVSLLAGLLSHIGVRSPQTRDYEGARGARFAIFPGSGLFKQSPEWLMSAELVETSRLWARMNARIDPAWVEPLAEHLLKRSYNEPQWSADSGSVIAHEKVTLYGLPIVAGRRVDYGRIDPATSRELFIRHALVEGDWDGRYDFVQRNRGRLRQVEQLEHRARRRNILVDDDTLYAFFDQRLGTEVVSAAHFDAWWQQTASQSPRLLDFSTSMLINEYADPVSTEDFPDRWAVGKSKLRLRYLFEPGDPADGVTVEVPIGVLNQVSSEEFVWNVPGLRREVVTELIRTLPKQLRRNFVPAPDVARRVLEMIGPSDGPLPKALSTALRSLTGSQVPVHAWDPEALPAHLRPTFQVRDERNRVLAEGKDLDVLRHRLRSKLRASLSAVASDIEQRGLTSWSFGTLPNSFERKQGGVSVKAFPALVDEGSSVAIRLLDTPEQQRASNRAGLRRLILLAIPSPAKWALSKLSQSEKLALSRYGKASELFDDCVACAADELIERTETPVTDPETFARVADAVRAELADTTLLVTRRVSEILSLSAEVEAAMDQLSASASLAEAVGDARSQLNALLRRGFVTTSGFRRLPDLTRYLRALRLRLQKLPTETARDETRMRQVQRLEQAYRERLASLPAGAPPDQTVSEVRWMLEELRVSLFAQQLGTAYPISEKRITRALASSD